MAKINFQGIEIDCSADEVGAVVQQLIGLTAEKAKRPALKGGEWPSPSVRPSPQPTLNGLFKESMGLANAARLTVKFLEAIKASGYAGVVGEDLAPVLEVSHPKGIGSKTAVINRVIESHGFNPSLVYENGRDPSGVRRWMSGPSLEELLKALQREQEDMSN